MVSGIARVNGGLAVSRSFGDILQREAGIISEPEIIAMETSPSDKFLVIATDGLWDVVKNETVAAVGQHFEAGKEYEFASRLFSLAVKGGSADNITIVIASVRKEFEFGEEKKSYPLSSR